MKCTLFLVLYWIYRALKNLHFSEIPFKGSGHLKDFQNNIQENFFPLVWMLTLTVRRYWERWLYQQSHQSFSLFLSISLPFLHSFLSIYLSLHLSCRLCVHKKSQTLYTSHRSYNVGKDPSKVQLFLN